MRSSFLIADLMQRSAVSRLAIVLLILTALWSAIFWAISLP